MDLQNMDLQGGSLQISTEVVGKIARCAALEVDGVAEVSCGVQNKKLKSLLESASIQPPVAVEMRDGQHHPAPDDGVRRTDPLRGRKGTGKRQVCRAEHD